MTVSETYGVISYGCGWRKDVVNQCLELIIIKRISRAPIYHTSWEHRALYNNTHTHTHTHAHARTHT